MPESRSRSRKRKAAAAKTDSLDAEKDVQSQTSCAAPKEERYIPRFGSSSKKPRTVSCSQPAPRATRRNNEVSDTTGERMLGSTAEDSPPTTRQLESCNTGCSTVEGDNTTDSSGSSSLEPSVQEMAVVGTHGLPRHSPPSVSQSQQTTDHYPTDSGDNSDACLSSIQVPTLSKAHSLDSALSPQAPDSQHANRQEDSVLDTVLDTVLAVDNTADHFEVKETLCKGDMNLDLLDPLECNDEEEEEEGDNKELMNIHNPAGATNTDDAQSDIKHPQEDHLSIDVATPTTNSHSTAQSSSAPVTSDSIISTQTPPVTSDSISTQTPPEPVTTTLSKPTSRQQVIFPPPPPPDVGGVDVSSDEPPTLQSIYDSTDTRGAVDSKKMSGSGCVGEGGWVGESGYTEEGVEDVVVVGGDSGQLLVANSSQDHTKHQTAVMPTSSPEELMAVREMMDLTAHDLLESQLLEEATVPSFSPLALTTSNADGGCAMLVAEQESNIPFSNVPSSLVATVTPAAEGSQILRGLIEELSALNQLILACKREVDASRRQRAAWMTSHHAHRGR